MHNLTKVWKQSPVVILQHATFYNIFTLCLWLIIIRRSDQGVQFTNVSSQIFLNDINLGYRAAILKKNYLSLLPGFMWLWLLIAIVKRCAEQCALQLYRTSLNTCYTSSILLCILKENFQKPTRLIFSLFCFHILAEVNKYIIKTKKNVLKILMM